jgi:hypothetical protein
LVIRTAISLSSLGYYLYRIPEGKPNNVLPEDCYFGRAVGACVRYPCSWRIVGKQVYKKIFLIVLDTFWPHSSEPSVKICNAYKWVTYFGLLALRVAAKPFEYFILFDVKPCRLAGEVIILSIKLGLV